MTDKEERPLKELRFLLMLADKAVANTLYYAEFLFPLMIFEETDKAPLLIPEPACENLVGNWAEMLPRLIEEAAAVDIPYQPSVELDINGYIFNVMIAYLDSDTPAFAEAMMLQKYAPRLWQQYRHLAKPFSFTD